MTTLRITVNNRRNAKLLTKILHNMSFVKNIEEENSDVQNQYSNLKKMFNSIEPNNLFHEITDPAKWQKELRNEW